MGVFSAALCMTTLTVRDHLGSSVGGEGDILFR